jgi:hypothetical protein
MKERSPPKDSPRFQDLLLGVFVWPGLLMWALIIFFIAEGSTPPLNDLTPLTSGRLWLGYAAWDRAWSDTADASMMTMRRQRPTPAQCTPRSNKTIRGLVLKCGMALVPEK